jgi:hypothetical protein
MIVNHLFPHIILDDCLLHFSTVMGNITRLLQKSNHFCNRLTITLTDIQTQGTRHIKRPNREYYP